MESRGGFAVLGLGQQVVPAFCQEEKPEEEEEVFLWPGGERSNSLGSHEEEGQEGKASSSGVLAAKGGGDCFASETNEEEEKGKEAALLELRRRRGRSFSLPSSPSLVRVFPDVGAEEEEEEEEEEGASSPSCCTKCNKKRVQFADSLGLCLASVKHFSAAEEPQVPPSVLSRLQSFPMSRKDLEGLGAAVWAGLGGGGGGGLGFSAAAAPPRMAAAPSTAMAPSSSSSSSQTPLRLQPRPEGAAEEATPRVSLEEVSGAAVSGAPSDVRGVVRVQKCPGPKEVTVRYTFNEWLSFLDASATPAESDDDRDRDNNKAPAAASSSSSSSSERYQFALCLPPGLDQGTAVHFAICYRSQQGEFWDNNGGANYTLRSAQD